MTLTRIRGNTWIAEGIEYIPFYVLDDRRCILLDTGLLEEREDLEQSLLDMGLTPAGILCSHAHVDHCANSGYFQANYHIPVAMSAPEAGMCSSPLTLKCYFLLLSPDMIRQEVSCMVHTPDLLLPSSDGPFSLAGAEFQILHTPGHSAGHVSVITPDNVCYTGDALLSQEMLSAKLPYGLSHADAARSREKLRGVSCAAWILAHRGVCGQEEIGALIDANHELFRAREEEILSLIPRPMAESAICEAVCARFQLLSHRPRRALRFERNVRFFLEHLTDSGCLEMAVLRGVTHYQPTGRPVPRFNPNPPEQTEPNLKGAQTP